jgi:type I restriction enzyme, S subunit
MIADLKPYPEYKESGLPWLGQVPGHWSVRRIKTVLHEIDCRSTDGVGTLLSLTRVRGLIPRNDMTEKVHSAKTLVGYKCYKPGQIVMNRMQAWSGMFGAGAIDGLVSPDYAVFDVLGGHAVKLVLERLKTPDLVAQFALESKGIGSGFNRLYTDRFGAIRISLPPPDEQPVIVRFLDWAIGRLTRAIRAKRKMVSLLNEQKQAIIHRAITRGLDPSVPLKPSGILWLGDIPAHWGIVRNMALFAHRVAAGKAGLPILQVSLRSGITAEQLDQFGRPKKLIADPTKYKLIYKGDIAYNTMRMWQGAVGVAPINGLVSPAYVVLNPRSDTCSEYYDFIFHTNFYKQQVNRQSTGIVSDRNRLYWDSFKQMPNIFPPRFEQEEIVSFILSETSNLNTAISNLEREINLLREYRTRLVADVVTGKLDVREAATHLPDEAPPEPDEDNGLDMDLEPADEDIAI